MPKMLVTMTLGVDDEGNIYQDTQTHSNSWGEVYKGILQLKQKLDQQVQDKRICPFNPKYGQEGSK